MAATFVVEDGTGKTDANAYVTEAEVDTYNDNHDADAVWSALVSPAGEPFIRRATDYLDRVYGPLWRSARFYETQALHWPRGDISDYDGWTIAEKTVPVRLKDACAYLAIRAANGDTFLPAVDQADVEATSYSNEAKSESVTYSGVGGSRDAKRYPVVERLLRDLIHSGPVAEVG